MFPVWSTGSFWISEPFTGGSAECDIVLRASTSIASPAHILVQEYKRALGPGRKVCTGRSGGWGDVGKSIWRGAAHLLRCAPSLHGRDAARHEFVFRVLRVHVGHRLVQVSRLHVAGLERERGDAGSRPTNGSGGARRRVERTVTAAAAADVTNGRDGLNNWRGRRRCSATTVRRGG